MPHRVSDFCFYFYLNANMWKLTGCSCLGNALRILIITHTGSGSSKNSEYICVATALGPIQNWPNMTNMTETYLRWPNKISSIIHTSRLTISNEQVFCTFLNIGGHVGIDGVFFPQEQLVSSPHHCLDPELCHPFSHEAPMGNAFLCPINDFRFCH